MFAEFGPAPLHLSLDLDTYEGPWQNVHRFRQRSGWLLVADATIQNQYDMHRERIIVGCDDHEQPIPSFQARHLTEVEWGKPIECMELPPDILDDLLCEEEGALIVRWHRQQNAILTETHEHQLARIAVIEGRAKAFIRRNDACLADLRRRRRRPDAKEEERALLTAAMSDLEADSDGVLAEMAETRASVRRSFEDDEERLWSQADLLVEVEPVHVVQWHSRRSPNQSLREACKTQFSMNQPTNLSAESDLDSGSKLLAAVAKARPYSKIVPDSFPIEEGTRDIVPDCNIPPKEIDDSLHDEPTVGGNNQWTPDRIAVLRQLWLDGVPAEEIVQRLGALTRNRVIGKAYRIGLPKREIIAPVASEPSASSPSENPPQAHGICEAFAWAPERVSLLEKMWRAGETAATIANALGNTSRNAVIGKAKRLGIWVPPTQKKPLARPHTADDGILARMLQRKARLLHFQSKLERVSSVAITEATQSRSRQARRLELERQIKSLDRRIRATQRSPEGHA